MSHSPVAGSVKGYGRRIPKGYSLRKDL